MKTVWLESLVKTAIIKSLFNECNCTAVEYDNLYGVLLNAASTSKLCPFNFVKYMGSIRNDTTGVFREWIQLLSEGVTVEVAGKRISRGISRLAKEYNDVLPEVMRGENSLAIMFRLFFLPDDALLSLPCKTTFALQLLKSALQGIILLDILFTCETFRGHTSKWWLKRILCSSTGLMNALQALSS